MLAEGQHESSITYWLTVGKACPKAMLYEQTGTMLMANRVLAMKLIFLHHIANLPRGTLARDSYEVQLEQGLPGLVSYCQPFLTEFGVSDITAFTKHQFKRLIREKMSLRNKNDLIQMAQSCKIKIDHSTFSQSSFTMKEYFEFSTG